MLTSSNKHLLLLVRIRHFASALPSLFRGFMHHAVPIHNLMPLRRSFRSRRTRAAIKSGTPGLCGASFCIHMLEAEVLYFPVYKSQFFFQTLFLVRLIQRCNLYPFFFFFIFMVRCQFFTCRAPSFIEHHNYVAISGVAPSRRHCCRRTLLHFHNSHGK